MTSLFNLILLCWMCTIVIGEVTFFWTNFEGKNGYNKTLADFSEIKIETYREGPIRIDYVCGPFIYKIKFNEYDPDHVIHYRLEYTTGEIIFNKIVYVCEFFDDFFRTYMLPMTKNHNDFPERGVTVCPILARKYNILPAKSLEELSAPSDLKPGEYKIEATFLKGGRIIGGFKGEFEAIIT